MKRLLFILLLWVLGLGSSAAYAQAKDRGAPGGREQINLYRKNLKLDSAKATEVHAVHERYKQEMKAAEADTTLGPSARGKRIQALMDKKNKRLEELLTPGQQQKLIPPSERVKPVTKSKP